MDSSSMPKIIDFKDVNIGPNKAQLDKEVAALLPTTFMPQEVSFEIKGVNTAFANALRRTVLLELPVYCLEISDIGHYKTNQKEMYFDYVEKRIHCIPISQSVDPNSIFELDIINNEGLPIRVLTSHLKRTAGKGSGPIFDETIPIAHLYPNNFMKIESIRVVKNYGYNFGGHVVAYSAALVPLDQRPLEDKLGPLGTTTFDKMAKDPIEAKERLSASMSDPRHFRILFGTNGTMEAKKIMQLVCNELINRFTSMADSYESNKKEYTGGALIIIPGENHTTANAIVRTAIEMYPQVGRINYKYEMLNKVLTIDIYDENPKNIFTSTIAFIIKQLKAILSQFS
jgi:DNA-directed RNA polymerase subunit L